MRREDINKKILERLYIKKLFSKKEISFLLKCNPTTIDKKMRKFNISARNRIDSAKIAMKKQIIKISKSKLENMYLYEKFSISEIAQKLCYCRDTVTREIKRHKIPLRTKAEAFKLGWIKKRPKKAIIAELYYKEKLTQEQIAKKLNRSMGYIHVLMKNYRLKVRKPDYYHTKYKKSDFSGDMEEKAYLIGFRLGDLYTKLLPSKKLVTAGTTSTKIEQIRLFKKLFKNYGNVWISKERKDGNRTFMVLLNRSFDFLIPKKDFIPNWIKKDKKYFLSFLAGYTDAEGCIFIAKNNVAGFRLGSYDKNIIQQIYKGLFKIGIICNSPKIHIKKGYKKRDGIIYKKDEWNFFINKKYPLQKLLVLLKPLLKHQKRLRDLKKAERNIAKRGVKT